MQKSKDSKGRWRNRTVAFRVSQREWEMIDGMVSLSGLQKQDYILRKLMDWEVTIQGSSRIYKALKLQMDKIYQAYPSFDYRNYGVNKAYKFFSEDRFDLITDPVTGMNINTK